MSSQTLDEAGREKANGLVAKVTDTSAFLRRSARRGGWSMPLSIIGITAGFWLVVWLVSLLKMGPLLASPVGVLLTVYGLGAAALLSVVVVGVALWLMVRQLGLVHLFQSSGEDD